MGGFRWSDVVVVKVVVAVVMSMAWLGEVLGCGVMVLSLIPGYGEWMFN